MGARGGEKVAMIVKFGVACLATNIRKDSRKYLLLHQFPLLNRSILSGESGGVDELVS